MSDIRQSVRSPGVGIAGIGDVVDGGGDGKTWGIKGLRVSSSMDEHEALGDVVDIEGKEGMDDE
jgi:hypothetical protein